MSSDESVSEPSDEEDRSSGSESETPQRVKVFLTKKLTWRSRELNEIIGRLDKRVSKKRSPKGNSMVIERKQGRPSNRKAPEDAPAWALA